MPNALGYLTPQEQEALRAFLRAKAPHLKCQVCGGATWDSQYRVTAERGYAGDVERNVEGSPLPLIPIWCSNCGNTLHFNALSCGIVK